MDFPDSWSGRRIKDEWTEETSGGFPINKNEEDNIRYCKNPQYVLKLNNKNAEKTTIFLSLGQSDGNDNVSTSKISLFSLKIILIIIYKEE